MTGTARRLPPSLTAIPTHSPIEATMRRQQALADDLVLLAEFPLPALEEALADIGRAIEEDESAFEGVLNRVGHAATRRAELERLRQDHRTFHVSVGQLRWLLDIVRRDNHGGNRQALGQYWRIVLEALGTHREDERRLLAQLGLAVPAAGGPGK